MLTSAVPDLPVRGAADAGDGRDRRRGDRGGRRPGGRGRAADDALLAALPARLLRPAVQREVDLCPGRRGRLSALVFLSCFLCKSVLYGVFVWARRALNSQKRRFPARAGRQEHAVLRAGPEMHRVDPLFSS